MNENSPTRDEGPLRLDRPRFRLRTLWLIVTLVCLALGAMVWIGPMGSFVLVLGIGLLVCHVVGNSIGTRLRDQTSEQLRQQAPSPVQAQPVKFAPATRLGLAGRVIGWKVAIACLVGASLGAYYGTQQLLGQGLTRAAVREVIVTAGSLAVLGGFAAFLATTFLAVGLKAFLESRRPL